MKKSTLILICSCLFSMYSLEAKNLQANLSYATFLAPQNGPYIETYLAVDGHSVHYKKNGDALYQASIEASLIFLQGDSIRYFDKFNLLSPQTADTLNAVSNFTDLHRISLPNGSYTMELKIKDNNAPGTKPYMVRQNVIVNYYTNVISISDIELINSYSVSEKESPLVKNGYDIVPYVDNFYGANKNTLKFYCEYYHTKSV
ncbi:MAG: hypothetical protein KA347_09640, partial [Bacteroidia bacterium]|nr:hypothetical protein [Bacteroidia bacterium]